jgi:hypothetical protein
MNQMNPTVSQFNPVITARVGSNSTTKTKQVNRYINLLSPRKYGGMLKYELSV